MKNWNIIRWENEPPAEKVREIEFTCVKCRKVSLLKVMGHPEAQLESGVIFDPKSPFSIPTEIKCPCCGNTFEKP
jgi:hypothetical protein